MATNQELREQINQKQAEINALERQIQQQTPADGTWNPADYVQNRWNTQKNSFTKNWAKIPAEAQQYIQEQIYKRKQSGVPLNKWFLRTLENYVKGYFEGVPDNWDISSWISRDSKMAEWINKSDNNNSNSDNSIRTNEGTITGESGYTAPADTVNRPTEHEKEKFKEYKERYGKQSTTNVDTTEQTSGPTEHEKEKFKEYKERYGNKGTQDIASTQDTASTQNTQDTQENSDDTTDIKRGIMSSDYKAKAREKADDAALNTILENPQRANEIRERTKQAEDELRERTTDHSLDADKTDYRYSATGKPFYTGKKPETSEQKQNNGMPVFEQKSDDFEVPQQDKPGNAVPVTKPEFEYSANGPSNAMDMALDMSMPVAEADKRDIFGDESELQSLINKIPDYDDKTTAVRYLNRIKYAQAELDRAEALGYEEGVINSTEQDLRLHKKYLQELLKRYNLVQE